MPKRNTAIASPHLRKQWKSRVRCFFDQPAGKRRRLITRQKKAAKIFPRPATGSLRPVVRCPTLRYNSKQRLGRGFTLDELKSVKLNPLFARTIGISVDYRRKNHSEEGYRANVARLRKYLAKLRVVPRKSKVNVKKSEKTGEKDEKTEEKDQKDPKKDKKKSKNSKKSLVRKATEEELKKAVPVKHKDIIPIVTKSEPDKPRAITAEELKFSAFMALRKAWADVHYFGIKRKNKKKQRRLKRKQKKAQKEGTTEQVASKEKGLKIKKK